MIVIDLFSGGGGLTEGFMREGYKIIAHVEKDKWACETLKTRIVYHYLKHIDDMDLYNEYLRKSTSYKHIDEKRKIIFSKYKELERKLDIEVLNKEFGNPKNEINVSDSSEIIKLIEKSMKYNNEQNVDLIIGGPPCQAYSIVGRARMKDKVEKDKRNYLFMYYKDIVEYFKPILFLFENVPGIITAKKGEIFKQIQKEFDSIGYKILLGNCKNIKDNILNAKDFGVPQNRKRVILFGFRKELNLKYPNFVKNKFHFSNLTTKSAIGDLTPLKPGEGDDFKVVNYPYYDQEKLTDYQKFIRRESIGIMNHRARIHNNRDLQIYKQVINTAKRGKQLKYNELEDKYKTHAKDNVFLDRFKVHWWENIPHTIVAHIAKDGHYNIHPDINQLRSLTVREAARIQSFPDNYKFEGPRTSQYIQVGNAVPPLMAQAIAKTIKEVLYDIKHREVKK